MSCHKSSRVIWDSADTTAISSKVESSPSNIQILQQNIFNKIVFARENGRQYCLSISNQLISPSHLLSTSHPSEWTQEVRQIPLLRMGLVSTRTCSSLLLHTFTRLWLVYSGQTETSHWLLQPRIGINAAAAARSSGLLQARVNFRHLCQLGYLSILSLYIYLLTPSCLSSSFSIL